MRGVKRIGKLCPFMDFWYFIGEGGFRNPPSHKKDYENRSFSGLIFLLH
jgi:hypothetical protein